MPIQEMHDVRVLVCKDQGTTLASERDANVFMSAAWELSLIHI